MNFSHGADGSTGTFSASSSAPSTVTGVSPGDLLVAFVAHLQFDSLGSDFTVADADGSYTIATPNFGGEIGIGIATRIATSAGSHTATATGSAGSAANSQGYIVLSRFSTGGSSASFDNGTGQRANSTTPSTGSASLTGSNDLLLVGFDCETSMAGATTPPVGGPGAFTNVFLDLTGSGNAPTIFAWQILSGALASINVNCGTLSTSGVYAAVVEAFTLTAAGVIKARRTSHSTGTRSGARQV